MTAEEKKKSKALLDSLHAKYYGKKNIRQAKAAGKPKATEAATPARHELMLKAKAKGIKNFRVINKEELIEILKEGTTHERIEEIVAGAVARWKKGWGTRKLM